MPDGGQGGPSGIARRLFADNPQLDERLGHLALGEFIDPQRLSDIRASDDWRATASFIRKVVSEKVPVLLFGDYDVDGSTASFLLFRWMRAQGAVGNIFLPSRFRHGYGLDLSVLEQAAEQGYRALVALDCGTANIAEIEAAARLGIEVLVIDHHTTKEQLPDAVLFNPHTLEALPPLCTAGLVHLAIMLLNEDGEKFEFGDEPELAGLATLADIVPLVPENWFLVHRALRLLPSTGNLGLQELLKISQLHGMDLLTARQLAFQLVPRLNAAGRMRSARLIADLFACDNRADARRQAAQLDLLNQERREVTDENFRQAARQALDFDGSPALVLYSEHWHIGVVGIVAARIAEQFQRPSLVLTQSPADPDLLTGSARSFGGISLVESLSRCTDDLVSFGGHAGAAGVKLQLDALDALRSSWSDSVLELGESQEPAQEQNGAQDWQGLPHISLGDISAQLEDELWQLAPFDEFYLPAPRCRLEGVYVARCSYMGRDKTHLNLTLADGERQVRVAGFNKSHLQPMLRTGERITPVVELEPDNWNNQRSVMLRLIGLINQDGSTVS